MSVLRYPLATEKAVAIITKSNVITYMVDFRASKQVIRDEFEKTFNVKVKGIRTTNMPANTKKAFIKLAAPYKASDVAVKLKLV